MCETSHPAGQAQNREAKVPAPSAGEVGQIATEQHPRDVLLHEIHEQEQHLLDKLALLRSLRLEYMFLPREEAQRIINVNRLQDQLRWPR